MINADVSAEFNLGIGALYSYSPVKENGGTPASSAYYFLEQNTSTRHGVGASLFLYKNFVTSRHVALAMGPSLDMGSMILDDKRPIGLSADGVYVFRLGIDFRMIITTVTYIRPYIKAGVGCEWMRIDWETNMTTPWFPDNISWREKSTGFVCLTGIGFEHVFKKFIHLFYEGVLLGGYFTSQIEGKFADAIPSGNPYRYLGFRVTVGVAFSFGASDI